MRVLQKVAWQYLKIFSVLAHVQGKEAATYDIISKCLRVSAASHGDDGVADHGRELGRLDRWLLPTPLKRISFLHRQCAERWETCLTCSEGCVLKLFFVTSKHMGWKLIWQINLTRRDSSWRCVFLSSRGRKSAAVHPQVRTAFQFSISFFHSGGDITDT